MSSRSIARISSGLAILTWTTAATAAPRDNAVYFPGQALANPDGALSLTTNPAGLAGTAGTDLRLQLSGAGANVGGNSGAGWGGYAAVPLGPLALAGSLEHADLGEALTQPWYARSRASVGGAARLGDRLFLGAASRWQTTEHGEAQTWDFGALLRPWSWLSLGARVSALHTNRADTPDPASESPITRWAWGAAVRPFASDRLTLAFDMEKPEGSGADALTASLDARIIKGLHAMVEYRDVKPAAAGADHDQRLALLLRMGFGTWGVDLGGHGDRSSNGDTQPGVNLGVRLSTDAPPSLIRQGNSAVSITLKGELHEHDGGEGEHFGSLILQLHRIAESDGVRLVVFKAESFSLDWAQVEELRAAIGALRAAGKKVVWYSEDLGTRGLALAAACDRIVVPPAGTVSARGIGGDFIGLKDALGRVGIAMQAVRFGDYKTAPEALTRDDPSDPLAEQIRHSLERQWQTFLSDVALGRDVTTTVVEAALEKGVAFPQDALDAKLVDAVAQPADLEQQLRAWHFLAKGDHVTAWRAATPRRAGWGRVPQLAVVELDGSISDHGGMSPLGNSTGGVDLAKTIKEAADSSAVRGIVMRVRSPGGTVFGSDAMQDALANAGKRKPVAVSMGGVAASGGYWLSLGAKTVFADRATVTGSIGIFAVKPSLQGLWAKLGLHLQHFGIGPHEGVTSLSRPWPPEEEAAVRTTLGRFYGLFLDRTVAARKLDRAVLPQLAEGRVWFGDEAKERGLVDRVGGLRQALDHVRVAAHLQPDDDYVVEFLPRQSLLGRLKVSMGLQAAETERDRALQVLQAAVGPWLDGQALLQMAETAGPLALLPVHAAVPGR